jgi:hypothetical protein
VQGPGEDVTDAMARIYVWLRYSSSRQLTWQRNYNTQPRILGEAQKRLTDTIAKARLCRQTRHKENKTCICLSLSSFALLLARYKNVHVKPCSP